MAQDIRENLSNIQEKIQRAARKAGRQVEEITLLAATKSVEPKRIKEALALGVRVFGENYVQEAEEKIGKIKKGFVKWHFIGHLQKNKAKFAVDLFDMIETLDSVELAKELNKKAQGPIEVLMQVNIGAEGTKGGVLPGGALDLAQAMAALPNIRLRGLMTIPPLGNSPEMSRPYFIMLRRLAERINRERIPGVVLTELSMGMSNDFDVAIEEGATIVRVGTALFGERTPGKKK